MAHLATEFPRCIAMGAVKSPSWLTDVVTVQSGHEQRSQVWSQTRQRYDVSHAVRTYTDYQLVLTHFHEARGRFNTFNFYDHLDFRVESSQGVMVGIGSGNTYQLQKRYGSGATAYDRNITRTKDIPVLYEDGVPVDSGDYVLNAATGRVDFVASPGPSGVLTWSGQFFTPCRYDTDALPSQIVDRNGIGGQLLVQCTGIALVEVRE